ncbi:MAG: phage tail protein [Lachnospiraceae bacterium]|nr:phage tail protein [Lachnospiraceae bacterium]
MAIIGSWGDIIFSVSPKEVNTFNGLKWDVGAKYASHERHLKDPLLEFTGAEIETMSFSMYFSVFLGINPLEEVTKVLKAVRNGNVNRLVIGTKAYGKNKWVMPKAAIDLERYDNKGNLLVAKVNVTLQSYAER